MKCLYILIFLSQMTFVKSIVVAQSFLSQDSKDLVSRFQNRGFSCELDLNQILIRGVQCKGRFQFYSEPVRVYFSKDFKSVISNDLNFFFHGFETSGDVYRINPFDTNGFGDFGARLAESGHLSGLIVVPESRSKGVTYQKFVDGTGFLFQLFLDEIKIVTELNFTKLTLAGHSGGRIPIAALVSYPQTKLLVKAVGLFDATYSDSLPIATWLNEDSNLKAWISWTAGGEVVEKTKFFISKVKRPKDQLTLVPTLGKHMDNIREGRFSGFLISNKNANH